MAMRYSKLLISATVIIFCCSFLNQQRNIKYLIIGHWYARLDSTKTIEISFNKNHEGVVSYPEMREIHHFKYEIRKGSILKINGNGAFKYHTITIKGGNLYISPIDANAEFVDIINTVVFHRKHLSL